MQFLYSNMPPLRIKEGQKTFNTAFMEAAKESDRLDIAVGYVSKGSLLELERIVDELGIQQVRLNMGMYMIEGIAESTYRTALDVNKRWQEKGVGKILLIQPFKYH